MVKFYNYILLVVLAIIWGSSFILMKKGLILYSPLELAVIRIILAALSLLPFLIIHWGPWFRKNLMSLAVVGIFGNAAPAYLFALAETEVSSSIAGTLNSLTPIFTLIMGIVVFKVPWNLLKSLGVIGGFLGALIIIFQDSGDRSENNLFFSLLIVLATLFYGTSTNVIKSKLHHLKPLKIVSASLCIAALPYLFILPFTEAIDKTEFSDKTIIPLGSIAVLAIIGTSLALYLFNNLVHRTNAVFAASVTYLIPIVALVFGWMDREEIVPAHIIGLSIILGSLLLISQAKRMKSNSS